MRTLTSALRAAQQAPDPFAVVQARLRRSATFAGDPLAWRPLFRHTAGNLPYGDAGVTAAACACAEAGAMVRVLRSQAAMKVGVQRFNVLAWTGSGASWPAAAAAALTAAPVDLWTLALAITGESTPAVGRAGNTIRAFYGDGGRLRYNNSTNDGVTWAASANVWNGIGVYSRLTNVGVCTGAGAAGAWHMVFNGVPAAGGAVRVRGVHTIGSGFVVWDEMPDAAGVGWQVVGVQAGGAGEPTPCVYVYLVGESGGFSCLACQRVKLNADGSFNSWDGVPKVVDRAGRLGTNAYARVRLGAAGGAFLLAMQEQAANHYWFVAALFGLPGSLDIEEPVFLGPGPVVEGDAVAGEFLWPVAGGRRSWLVGAGEVFASAQSDDGALLAVRTYTPIRYQFEVSRAGGGELNLLFPRTLSEDQPPEDFRQVGSPEIYVGDLLWLDRTLLDGAGQGGTMTLAWRVQRVLYTRAGIEVLAADALGVLARLRARRPKLLLADERTRWGDVDAVCHWAGLEVTGGSTIPLAVYPSPGFVLPPNDSALNALLRYLTDQTAAVRSAGATSGGQSHTTIELLALPSTSSYTYISPSGRAEGLGVHEIADWALGLDSRQPRLLVARGLVAHAEPDGDLAHALAAARMLPGVRPVPLVLVDYSFAADDGSLEARAEAEAQRLVVGLPLGWIESTANLGVELYDVVTVDETKGRVVKIVESWEQGRLRQRLELAEVNAFGVSVG